MKVIQSLHISAAVMAKSLTTIVVLQDTFLVTYTVTVSGKLLKLENL